MCAAWLARSPGEALTEAAPAIVVGAVGGSGTRLIVQMAEAAGIFVGRDLNRSLDSVPGTTFLRRHLPRVLAAAPLREDERTVICSDLRDALVAHRRGIDRADVPWLIKNPRWSHALALLAEVVPNVRFVHVVRDGRDMAFSQNQGQVRDLGDLVLGETLADAPPPVRSAAFWARQNLRLAEQGERLLGEHYLRLRYEDLCGDPRGSAATLLAFLEAPAVAVDGAAAVDAAAALVRPSTSIGRWREQTPEIAAAVAEAARPALAPLGYSD